MTSDTAVVISAFVNGRRRRARRGVPDPVITSVVDPMIGLRRASPRAALQAHAATPVPPRPILPESSRLHAR